MKHLSKSVSKNVFMLILQAIIYTLTYPVSSNELCRIVSDKHGSVLQFNNFNTISYMDSLCTTTHL